MLVSISFSAVYRSLLFRYGFFDLLDGELEEGGTEPLLLVGGVRCPLSRGTHRENRNAAGIFLPHSGPISQKPWVLDASRSVVIIPFVR